MQQTSKNTPLAEYYSQFYTSRQRLTTNPPVKPIDKNVKPVKTKALTDAMTLQEAGIDPSTGTLYVKDLGTQVSYRTVFIVEYVSWLYLTR